MFKIKNAMQNLSYGSPQKVSKSPAKEWGIENISALKTGT